MHGALSLSPKLTDSNLTQFPLFLSPPAVRCECRFNVTTLVHQPIPYKVKAFEWCPRIPPRCPVEKTEFRNGWRNDTKLVVRTVRVCCEGFAQVEGRCLRESFFFLLPIPCCFYKHAAIPVTVSTFSLLSGYCRL